jgi:hypothetical protein
MSKISPEVLTSQPSHLRSSCHRSSGFTLEELSEDDIGYDADIEVVRPEYEDVESGNEDDHDGQEDFDEGYDSQDPGEILADRLRGLYCDPKLVSTDALQSPKKGQKRMSRDMAGGRAEGPMLVGREDFEIMELSVHTDEKQAAKRQRKRLARSKTGERIVRLISQDRSENTSRCGAERSALASSSSSIEQTALPETEDLQMTDVI